MIAQLEQESGSDGITIEQFLGHWTTKTEPWMPSSPAIDTLNIGSNATVDQDQAQALIHAQAYARAQALIEAQAHAQAVAEAQAIAQGETIDRDLNRPRGVTFAPTTNLEMTSETDASRHFAGLSTTVTTVNAESTGFVVDNKRGKRPLSVDGMDIDS